MTDKKGLLEEQFEKEWFKRRQGGLPAVYRQFGVEVKAAHDRLVGSNDLKGTWKHLERAHILSQASAWRHVAIHFLMFLFAIWTLDFPEAIGQLPRLLLAGPSSLFRLAPRGNTGGADVGLFEKLPLPKDLEGLF